MTAGQIEAGAASSVRPFRIGIAIALVVIIVDQISKYWIVEIVMDPPRVIPVTSYFNLVMAWNRGVSFGMLDSGSQSAVWALIGVAVAIVVVLGVWLWRTHERLLGIALGLIIGGALGNVIDRIRYGAVADFLDVHVSGFHWPAFNAADSAITVGAVVVAVDALFLRSSSR